MTYEEAKTEIEKISRFESLVHMPEKKDPGWPQYVARATADGVSTNGQGETDLEAMQDLLEKLQK